MSQPAPRHPFDADRFLEGFTEEPERVIHAEDDPELARMAHIARVAWEAFERATTRDAGSTP